jgi:hypothetical protein
MPEMRSWTLAGAFDAGHIRGGTPGWERDLNFHQLEMTGHGRQLEADYRLFREEFGLTRFRDGAWLTKSYPRPGHFDWSHLDRLASISNGEVTLSLCHYEWLPWISEDDIWSGRVIDLMQVFAHRVAERYRGRFAAYIPVVECGYWVAMMTDWARWWPARAGAPKVSWWKMYSVVGRMMTAIARGVKESDPEARIAMSEPWAWHPHVPLEDQARPMNNLLGRPDPVARRELGTDDLGGASGLLDVVGLNFYNNWGAEQGWPLSRLILEARKTYPDLELAMGETGNCHFSECHTVEGRLRLTAEQVEEANQQGAELTTVTWAPILTLGDFDWGQPAPGAWVTWELEDPSRRRHWDAAVARVVCRYTSSPAAAAPSFRVRGRAA